MPLPYPKYRFIEKSCKCGYFCADNCSDFRAIRSQISKLIDSLDIPRILSEKIKIVVELFDFLCENWGYFSGAEVFQHTVWNKLNGEDLTKGFTVDMIEKYKNMLYIL